MAAVRQMPYIVESRHHAPHSPLLERNTQHTPMEMLHAYSHAPQNRGPASGFPFLCWCTHQPQLYGEHRHHSVNTAFTSSLNANSTSDPIHPKHQLHHPVPQMNTPLSSQPQQIPILWQQPLSHSANQFISQQSAPISPQHGPPRRPIQSQHALWVGNIPSHAHILALRDHFYTAETAKDILSVVFTPASNSGFVNFRSDDACKASMRRFNKSFLYGVALNCRARKTSTNNSSLSRVSTSEPPESSRSSPPIISPLSPSESSGVLPDDDANRTSSHETDTSAAESHASLDSTVLDGLGNLNLESNEGRNRFFIIKSLTYDDLTNSVKSRRWSTQAHNEQILDEAFKKGDDVFLIFSVNRSREYFGYARMTSAANFAPAPVVTSTPLKQAVDQSQSTAKPPIVSTPAIGVIPAGHIVDELCRGKIFWEIDNAEMSSDSQGENAAGSTGGPQKSFAVEWLSLRRVPFRQTTHLRNSLNDNKEVKIARDGTELDADVGRKLCSLFHGSA